MVSVDATVLHMALPSLAGALHASSTEMQWVLNSYTLTAASCLLLGGGIADRIGRRRTLLIGIGLFMLASVASALATSAGMLTGTRAVMGLGAALMMPASMSTVIALFPDTRRRLRALGMWSAASGLGLAAGPLLGGLLLSHFSWRSVFLVNVPLSLCAYVGVRCLLRPGRAADARSCEWTGAAALGAAAASTVAVAMGVAREGWTALDGPFTWVLLVSLVVFAVRERVSYYPVLGRRLRRDRRYTVAVAALSMVFLALMGVTFFLAQYLQLVLGLTALDCALRLLPTAAAIVVVAPASGRVVARHGIRATALTGLTAVAAALAAMLLYDGHTGTVQICATQLLLGLGVALGLAPATESAAGALAPARVGVGTAVSDASRQVGGALGVALTGAVLHAVFTSALASTRSGAAPGTDTLPGALAAASRMDERSSALASEAAREAFVTAMHAATSVNLLVVLSALVLVYRLLPADSDHRRSDEGADHRRSDDARPSPVAATSQGVRRAVRAA